MLAQTEVPDYIHPVNVISYFEQLFNATVKEFSNSEK
jgi:hypothetical protein